MILDRFTRLVSVWFLREEIQHNCLRLRPDQTSYYTRTLGAQLRRNQREVYPTLRSPPPASDPRDPYRTPAATVTQDRRPNFLPDRSQASRGGETREKERPQPEPTAELTSRTPRPTPRTPPSLRSGRTSTGEFWHLSVPNLAPLALADHF